MNEVAVLINQEAGVINCNLEEVKKNIKDRLKEFDGAQFTEESKDLAKKEVAQLRKEQKEMQSLIISAKKEYMKPFDDFKKKADELLGMYDESITYINDQVKEMEEKRKKEKKVLIEKLYDEVISPLKEYLPMEKIYDTKWENSTVKENAIRKQMGELVLSTQEAVKTICSMNSESVQKALEIYKNSLSVTEAVTYINNYERQKAEILEKEKERKAQEEIQRVRDEERRRIEQERRVQEDTNQKIQVAREEARQELVDSMIPDTAEVTKPYIYKLELGEKSRKALEIYLDSVGIDWTVM